MGNKHTSSSANATPDSVIRSVDVIKYYLDNEFKQHGLSLNIPQLLSAMVDEYLSMDKWDKDLHGKDIKFITDNRIKCDSQQPQSAMITYIFTKQEFSKISFIFTIHSYSYYSWIGFTAYLQTNYIDFNESFNKNDNNTFIVGTFNGIDHASFKTKTGSFEPVSVRTDNIISKNKSYYTFKENDRFIFDFDFDKNVCNLYVNKIKSSNLIKRKEDKSTWNNIFDKITPVYMHSKGISDITFSVHNYKYK
eukprot:497146_1